MLQLHAGMKILKKEFVKASFIIVVIIVIQMRQ
jgi:hypothetical protein